MYKILVSAMAFDGGKSGISVYIAKTIEALAAKNRLDVIILRSDIEVFPVRSENINFIVISDSLKKPVINMLWHLYILPFRIKWKNYDLVFLPAGNRRLFSRYPGFTVTTVHDFSQLHIPGKYDAFRMFYIKRLVPYYLRKIQHIMTVSESTAVDTIDYCRIPLERITVNFNGYDQAIYNQQVEVNTEYLAKRYEISGKYLLYVSRLEHPGKNHLNLIKAYELLPQEIKETYLLVLAGSDWSGSDVVKAYAAQSPDSERIIFTGFIDFSDLPVLYRGAELYVFPSFFEGFGLPVVEAMACGTPVVCSNCSSLPEIGGEAVKVFNPDSQNEMAEVISKVLQDESIRQDMIDKGFDRLNLFDWNKHADKLIEIYEHKRK